MPGVGFSRHNHSECIRVGLDAADIHCKSRGLQFTPIRRRVLEILLAEHNARGAYEILDRLREEGFGSQPPVVYRALDFLVANGFVHKIEHLNAFVACAEWAGAHNPVFLICRSCDSIVETQADLDKGAMGRMVKSLGFLAEKSVVEVEGLCVLCQS